MSLVVERLKTVKVFNYACLGINTVRSDGTILRPMNAFMLWAKEKRVEMMKQGLQVAEVSQVIISRQESILISTPRHCLNNGSG